MILKRSLVLTGPVLLAFCAALPVTQAAGSDFASVKAGSYKVEPYHTQVGFAISHFGFTNYRGLFSGASGELQLDPANLRTSKLNVSIPVDSILTTVPNLTAELKKVNWFDTSKFPTATFSSTKVVPAADGAIVTGNLTLHGVTKPVVLKVRFIGAGINPIDKAYTVGFEATSTIKRSDFGITTYVPLVGNEVRLNIAGAFEQQQK